MKSILRSSAVVLLSAFLLSGCKNAKPEMVSTGGPEKVSFRALQFPLTDVRLLDGPFLNASRLDEATLLSYEPDRLLAGFYSEAGLKPKAEHYNGWESMTIAGHSLGHYLSACAMMYQTSGDKRFLERVNYIVSELKFVQDKVGNGYFGAFPNGKKILEDEVAKGNIRSQGFDLNGIWVPFYTQHKIMAGLRDAYRLCGNTTALEVEKRLADWLEPVVSGLTDEQVQKMLRCEHGGINETLADLYADTQDARYLKLSKLFYQKIVLDSLKAEKDILPGRHCNTNIPKLIGLSRLYELTGDSSDRRAAEFFWKTVVYHHSYVTGGNGNNEYFGPADKLRDQLGENTTETCNVYNMLKLTEHLFEWDASAHTADFYERALFNHILSSQNPLDGHVVYNLSLDMGGYKYFQDPFDFTCCIGTGMETHSKYGRNIYYHNNDELFLFQYIASELTWKERGLTLTQNTSFPEEQGTSLVFKCDAPQKFTLQVRCPYWAENGIKIIINGKEKNVKAKPGSYIPVKRTWQSGDKVDIKFPFTLRLEAMPDDSSRIAVMYGPLVLAGDLGPVKDSASADPMYVPVLMTSKRNPAEWMKAVAGKANTFVTVNTGRPRDIEMKPLYTIYDRRYSVFFDLFTDEAWKQREADYLAAIDQAKKIKAATIDFVQPGEMQPERNHNFRGEKTTPGNFKDRANRESRGGWFSFDMKVNGAAANTLAVEYWGGFPGAKTFDITINDKIIATENITNKKDGRFINVIYDIPETLTRGKSKVTVKFTAHPNNMAGPVFGVRTIKK